MSRVSREAGHSDPIPVDKPSTSTMNTLASSYESHLSSLSDHTYAIMESPRKLKRRCDLLQEQLRDAKRVLYNIARKQKRSQSKLSVVLAELEKQRLVSKECQNIIERFNDIPVHLFRRDSRAYTDEQQQFATTQHFYSPKAYQFCKKHLHLPAEMTLRRWMSGVKGEPGFSQQVFDSLKDAIRTKAF